VCLGNICRSPAAEGVLRQQVQEAGLASAVGVGSAGTIGWHEGKLPDARMRAAAARRGYTLESRARHFTARFFADHDLIVTMDASNLANVLALAPNEASRAKVRAFCSYCRSHADTEVPDPYYGGPEGFEYVLDLLEDGCSGIVDELRRAGA
jgi:protein-tyrosine phosphatase